MLPVSKHLVFLVLLKEPPDLNSVDLRKVLRFGVGWTLYDHVVQNEEDKNYTLAVCTKTVGIGLVRRTGNFGTYELLLLSPCSLVL